MKVNGGFGVFDGGDNSKGLLCRSLLWHRGDGIQTLPKIEFPQDRESVPSWSWMAVSGGINYFEVAFNGYDWQPIEPPWSSSTQADSDKVIKASACNFQLPPTESQESKIIFDDCRRSMQDCTRAIVLGKKHFILVVDLVVGSVAINNSVAHENCRRVGAGYLTGKCLTGGRIPCALI
jgi:hypothetical protein